MNIFVLLVISLITMPTKYETVTIPIKLEPKVINVPVTIKASEISCLAKNLYFEARGEGLRGMLAVGYVTLNRVKDKRFPSSICNVVYQPSQFSWTNYKHAVTDKKAFEDAYKVATSILYETDATLFDFTHGSIYFHSTYVKPFWSYKFVKVTQVGNHIFYRDV